MRLTTCTALLFSTLLASLPACKSGEATTEAPKDKPSAPAPEPPKTAAADTSSPEDVSKPAPDKVDLATRLAPPKDVAGPPADAVQASGLWSKVLSPGKGTDHPGPDAAAIVNYSVWTTDGKLVDSTYKRGETRTLELGKTIAGFSDGIRLMVEGERRRIWIPEKLAYKGRAGKPAGMLVVDMELVGWAAPPEAPSDVKHAPKDAHVTPSGLAWKELSPGTGKKHPGPETQVVVHYSGWTTDGKCFDSSVMSGEPARFALDQVIPGWTEGLQLMVAGEKVRFWIPEKLAYAGKPGKPRGMLVFDVELLDVPE